MSKTLLFGLALTLFCAVEQCALPTFASQQYPIVYGWTQQNFDNAVDPHDVNRLLLQCWVQQQTCDHDTNTCSSTWHCDSTRCTNNKYTSWYYTASNMVIRNASGGRVLTGSFASTLPVDPTLQWLQTLDYTGHAGSCYVIRHADGSTPATSAVIQ